MFGTKIASFSVQNLVKLSRRTTVHNLELQFVRCESILAEKLVYTEYGDAVKVVRHEKEKLPAPKDNEVSKMRGFINAA
jgi:hypothetical protein